jgi:hypothetical protein
MRMTEKNAPLNYSGAELHQKKATDRTDLLPSAPKVNDFIV